MRKNLISIPKHRASVSEKIDEKQVRNNTGGFVYQISPEQRLKRFLILGSPTTYYQHSKELTKQNLDHIAQMWKDDPKYTASTIKEISVGGRAPNNDYALAALAVGVGLGGNARVEALAVLNDVARIGTHLFHFAAFLKGRSGYGRSVRTAFKKWYLSKSADKLALQILKYGSRDGWSHKDIIWLGHVLDNKTPSLHKALMEYAAYDKMDESLLERVRLVRGYELIKKETNASKAAALISEFGLTREMVPTQFLNSKEVWQVLFDGMVESGLMEALLRNLNKLSNVGIFDNSDNTQKAVAVLTSRETLQKARLHPLKILNGLATYQTGHGLKGGMAWTPNRKIINALDDAFYAAFDYVEPTNKRVLLGIDVSGSMGFGNIDGTNITPRIAAACMAMLFARTEQNHDMVAFQRDVTPFPVNPRAKIDEMVQMMERLDFGCTNIGGTIEYAMKREMEVDTFIIITDNEVNSGKHPAELLKRYRKDTGIDAKMVVVGMTATNFSIADPNDPGMLDMVGFDTAAPEILRAFMVGEI